MDLLSIILQLTESADLDPQLSSSESSGTPVAAKGTSMMKKGAIGAAATASSSSSSRQLPPVGCHLALPDARFTVREEDVEAVVGLLLNPAAAAAAGGASRGDMGEPGMDHSAVCVVAEPGQAKGALAAAVAHRIWGEGAAPGGCFAVDLQVWKGMEEVSDSTLYY